MDDAAVGRAQWLLALVRAVGIVDAVLLVALVACSMADVRPAVAVLGPLHGVVVLALFGLVLTGATHRLWGWWFPAITLVLAGAIGALIGERVVAHGLPAAAEA